MKTATSAKKVTPSFSVTPSKSWVPAKSPLFENWMEVQLLPAERSRWGHTIVLVPCLRMEAHTYRYFWWYGYFWGPWVSLVMTDEFSVRITKITSRIGVSRTHSLPLPINLFKLNELWPYYQKNKNQIILNRITL